MPSRRGCGGPALLLLALLVTAVPLTAWPARASTRASTATRTRTATRTPTRSRAPARHSAPPPPKPGWLVDRARFEPLTPSGDAGVLDAAGVGAYRGAIEVGPSPTGGVAVVNDVGLEDYVRGISEVPSTWPVEALKAQAIAARTYALHELAGGAVTAATGVGAQICATDACQVYTGAVKERADRAESGGNWANAVAQTAGQVVLYKGAPINAKYSSSNGGQSVAGGQPYLRSVRDPEDVYSPLHQWRSTVALSDLAAALALPGTMLNVGRDGDAILIDWAGADGTPGRLAINVNDFRARLNALPAPAGLPAVVPSNNFAPSVDAPANALVLDGRGWGHGIGMSQWGAYGKALRGLKAGDILAAYYAGLRPTAVAPTQLPKTIRVAVDLGRPEAGLSPDPAAPAARFRVLDGTGKPLAVAATGVWRVVPENGRVRVLPPPGQDGPPSLQALAVDPAAPTTQTPVRVRFRLNAPAPALVRITVADEHGGQAAIADAGLRDPGDVAASLPAPAKPGRYVVTIEADSGGGRVATVPMAVDVGSAPGDGGWAAPVQVGQAASAAGARLLLAGVTARRHADHANRAGGLAAALLLLIVAGAAAEATRMAARAAARPRLH